MTLDVGRSVLCAAVVSLMGCSALPRNAVLPDVSSQALVARFRPCVGALGAAVQMPKVAGSPRSSISGEHLPLADAGLVSDGYYHWLVVDRRQMVAHIFQVGGIAGAETVFGPFSLTKGCSS